MKYLKKCQIFIITTESTMMQVESEQQIFDSNAKRNSEDLYQMFSFELSDWQKLALGAINKGDHCLVTAPTGSGKTLPAEYAIRHFTKMNKKVIYTSPLKALSNQKYNDFQQEFPDISFGILTGDIKDNETADVLIMTTEILCNYLHNYKKTTDERKILDFNIDVEHDLGCVIFDEVHYINDLDRGTVWEDDYFNAKYRANGNVITQLLMSRNVLHNGLTKLILLKRPLSVQRQTELFPKALSMVWG